MIPDMDLFLDFCITCDRQVEEGHLYCCCEDCRMAEHDESSRSSSTVSSPQSPGGLSTWPTAPPGMPLYLAPGYHFRHAIMIRKATTSMPVRSSTVPIHRPRPTPCFLPAAPAPAPSKWPGFLSATPEPSKLAIHYARSTGTIDVAPLDASPVAQRTRDATRWFSEGTESIR